jgi:hypothetical protein
MGLMTLRGESAAVRQVVLAWFAGSMIMGTVAVLFLLLRRPDAGPGIETVEPLGRLPVLDRMVIIVLVLDLLVVLAAIASETLAASWMPAGARSCVVWAVLTWLFGLIAWFFAASVTFGANFGPGWQVVLAYLGSGLPFALVAGLLQSSWLVNLAAAGLSLWLVAAGFILVARYDMADPDALRLSVSCFGYLFGGAQGTGP